MTRNTILNGSENIEILVQKGNRKSGENETRV